LRSEIDRRITAARAELRAGNMAAVEALLDEAERAAVGGFGGRDVVGDVSEALREVRVEAGLHKFVTALRQAGLDRARFAVIGGLAVRARTGMPRKPKDVDIAILLSENADRWRLVRALEAVGFVVRAAVTGRYVPGPDGVEMDFIDASDPTNTLTAVGFLSSESAGRRPVAFDITFDEVGIEGLLVRYAGRVEGFVVDAPIASILTLIVSKVLSWRVEDRRDLDDLFHAATPSELAEVRSVIRRLHARGADWRADVSADPTIVEPSRALPWWQRILRGHRVWVGIALVGLVAVTVALFGVDIAGGIAGVVGFTVLPGDHGGPGARSPPFTRTASRSVMPYQGALGRWVPAGLLVVGLTVVGLLAPVSLGRLPNRTCPFPGIRLSTSLVRQLDRSSRCWATERGSWSRGRGNGWWTPAPR
jgi:hypothetical protein